MLLVVSIVTNLSILGFFKYFNFFIDSAAFVLTSIGFQPNMPLLRVIVPVGISFYTFQTMSYTIDIYRNRLVPTRNFVDFALFVSFFPQLVAGPIERAKNLLPQICNPRHITRKKILTAARKCVKIGTSLILPEGEMEQVLLVFSRCNALMLMLAAIVAYRAMDRYGLYALGRRRVF